MPPRPPSPTVHADASLAAPGLGPRLASSRARKRRSKALQARRARQLRRRVAVGAIAAVLLAGTAYALLTAPSPMDDGMPAFAHRTPDIHAAYTFASSDAGQALQWMPCYCGCGTSQGHTDNRACFVKGDGTGFDEHGSMCSTCVDIALATQQGLEEGKSLMEIRHSVDEKYVGYPPMDTPMPP